VPPSWATSPLLAKAVRIAKLSPEYRRWRRHLACIRPDDVWLDDSTGLSFVAFRLRGGEGRPWRRQIFLFATDTHIGEVVRTAVIAIEVSHEGWKFENHGPSPAE
jgi:hypothetical protein